MCPYASALESTCRRWWSIRTPETSTGRDPDTAAAIDADFKVVEEQVKKPEPMRCFIQPKLESIAMGSVDQAAGAAQCIIEKATSIAAKLGGLAGRSF